MIVKKVAIVTDSNSGITQARAKELGVYVVPMIFYIDGKEYVYSYEIVKTIEANIAGGKGKSSMRDLPDSQTR